jgi:hypothetical protein
VGRVGAHVDALRPRTLEWILHQELHAADAVDLEIDDLAVLKGAQALVIGAAGDEIVRS